MNSTSLTVSTKVTKDAEAPIKTDLTINWEGMTPEDIRAMAQAALVVKWQAKARQDGIPTACTINATDYRVGTRAPKKSLVDQLAALPPADRAALIAKLQESLAG